MNIHTPARQPNETQSDYKARRRQSAKRNRVICCVGLNGGSTSRQKQRADAKKAGNFKAGTYGRGLRNHITELNYQRLHA